MRSPLFVGLVLLAGCDTPERHVHEHAITPVVSMVSMQEDEHLKTHAAGSIVYLKSEHTPGPSKPDDEGQEDGARCEKCDGTGTFRPDGTIPKTCPRCKGDGIVGIQDIAAMQMELDYADVHARAKEQKDSLDSMVVEPKPKRATISWFSTPEAAWKESLRTGKPAFVYWTGEKCKPCREADRAIFGDSDVQTYLANSFVCAKVNVETFPKARLKKWKVSKMPSYSVVPADWKGAKFVKPTFDPDEFLRYVSHGKQWTRKMVIESVSARAKQMRMQFAFYQTPIEEQEPIAGMEDWSEPIETTEPVEAAATVEPVQYIIVQGGAGSSGGQYSGYGAGAGSSGGQYSGYAQAAPVYAAPSYGSAGGGGGVAMYGYSGGYSGWGRPMYSNGYGGYGGGWGGRSMYTGGRSYGYGGGGTIVCGPNGCFVQ